MVFDRGSHELNDTASLSTRAVAVCNDGVWIDASDDGGGDDNDNDNTS
jgi:hypothetical protein